MRRIILDTETTGLEPEAGHRVIEAAALELVDRRLTGATFHRYFDPEREIEAAAEQVHGISYADLVTQPKFADLADEFLAFLDGAELIHPQRPLRSRLPRRGAGPLFQTPPERTPAGPGHPRACPAPASRATQQPRCSLRPLRGGRLAPNRSRRTSRRGASDRGLPRDDRRPDPHGPRAGFGSGPPRPERDTARASSGAGDGRRAPAARSPPGPARSGRGRDLRLAPGGRRRRRRDSQPAYLTNFLLRPRICSL